MSEKIWSDDAWDDYLYWQTQDKKTLTSSSNSSPTIDKLKIILYHVTNIKGMMSVSYFRLPVPQRAITKPLVWRL